MHSDNLSQITLSNMWLLVPIDCISQQIFTKRKFRILAKFTKHSNSNILKYFSSIRKAMCSLSNLSSSKDGHGFDTWWIYDSQNQVWIRIHGLLHISKTAELNQAFIAHYLQVEKPRFINLLFFNNLKMPKLCDLNRKRKLQLQ